LVANGRRKKRFLTHSQLLEGLKSESK
jgi:hypothetical protein